MIVATQMLESMIMSPTPTRAEASDVATAVFDGADAVMLSAETASGEYPVEAVTMMDRIVRRVEKDPIYRTILDAVHYDPESTAADAISAAARQVAHTIGAVAIVTYTTSGSTTLRAARERPEVPILCLTSNLQTARRMGLVLGRACGAHRGCQQLHRDGRQGLPPGQARRLRRRRAAHRGHGRRALRHPRQHQCAAHRLDRGLTGRR